MQTCFMSIFSLYSFGHGRYIKQCISQQATGEAINWGQAAAWYVLYGLDAVGGVVP